MAANKIPQGVRNHLLVHQTMPATWHGQIKMHELSNKSVNKMVRRIEINKSCSYFRVVRN
jgi:hypothetical protein